MTDETKQPQSIKVVLADDHPMLMTGFAAALRGFNIEVVGEAMTPSEAKTMFFELKPDVLVLDISFGQKETGIDAAKDILKEFPEAKIIFFSQFEQDSLIKEAYRIGGFLFVLKNCDAAQLAAAVKHASEGKRYFVPEVADRFARWALDGDGSPLAVLDAREYEIFMLMARGYSNVEVSEKTNISTKTVSIITTTIKRKLGAERSADLTMLAMTLGLLGPWKKNN